MSVLSDFLPKVYPGLSVAAGVLGYSHANAVLEVAATDTTSGGANYPIIRLKTARNAANAGGQLRWNVQNATPAYVDAAIIQGSLNTLTAAAESATLNFSLLAAGATKTIAMRGDLSAMVPSVAAAWALGTAALPWSALQVGDGTVGLQAAISGTTAIVGTTSAHSLTFATNGTVQATIDSSGRIGLIGAPVAGATLNVGGTIPTNQSTTYGVASQQRVPVTTASYYALYAKPTIATGATTTSLYGLAVHAPTLESSAAITASYGVYVSIGDVGTSNIACALQVAADTDNWNVYAAGTAQNYFAGRVGIGVTVPTSLLDVVQAASSSAIGARVRGTDATSTGTVVSIETLLPYATAAQYLLVGVDSGGFSPLRYRNDGALMLAAAGVSATQLNSSLVSINGRISVAVNNTYDQFTNAWSVSRMVYDSGTTNVTTLKSKAIDGIWLTDLQVAASAFGYGYYLNVATGNTANAAAKMVGVSVNVTDAGSGILRAGEFIAVNASSPGDIAAIYAEVNATVNLGSIIAARINSGTVNYGLSLKALVAGAHLNYGIWIDQSIAVTYAALYYWQRGGSTADFLHYRDSGADDVFVVDYLGNLQSHALGVYSNYDVQLGPAGAATTMTAGFPYIPSVAGVATGVPTARAGFRALVIDETNHKIGYYNGGWKWTAALT